MQNCTFIDVHAWLAARCLDPAPQLPIPVYKALPHEAGCKDEAVIVCASGHIQGRQGVALDDLVYIMTRQASDKRLRRRRRSSEAALGALPWLLSCAAGAAAFGFQPRRTALGCLGWCRVEGFEVERPLG